MLVLRRKCRTAPATATAQMLTRHGRRPVRTFRHTMVRAPVPSQRVPSPALGPRRRDEPERDRFPRGRAAGEKLTFLATVVVQQEKREASAAQIGQEDASVAAPARQDRAAEIHELENRLAALRMQADEALARQLAEEEARGGPPS